AEVYDAKGCLACPGLIETHIHLDKSRIIDRCAPQERKTLSPVKGVSPLKASMSVEDVRARVERTLQDCIKHGATRMRTQVEIDIHLDVGPTADAMNIYLVRELTDEFKRGGRVVVGHMAKLSLLPPDQVAALARTLANTGIAVTVLPTTDLFLMGRDRDHAVVRGVADANLLCEHGVNCSLSSNNILNPATPYGDCSLIRMANLYANVLQVDRPERLRECFGMLTDRSARLLNLTDYGLAVGRPADIVILNAESPEQAIAEIAQPLAVFKHGRQTVVWHPPQLLRPR